MQTTSLQRTSIALAVLGLAAALLFIGANAAFAATSPTPTVTIVKQIDGNPATQASANSVSFPMTATWNDPSGIGSGTGQYTLGPNTTPAYQAQTVPFQQGADYSTSENTTGTDVGPNCSQGQQYRLLGYTTGDSLAQAMAAERSSSANLTNIQNNKYILVWNATCVPTPSPVSPANGSATTTAGQTMVDWTDVTDPAGGITYVYQASNASSTNPDGSFTTPVYTSGPLIQSQIATPNTPAGTYYWHVQATDANGNTSSWSTPWSFIVDNSATSTPPAATSTVQVHIAKRINGVGATALNASSTSFTMNATWNDPQGIGSGSGTYQLDANSSPAYQTQTIPLNQGANYGTSEVMNSNVGATCADGKPYALDGYSTGTSAANASSTAATSTAPNFTNLQHDEYVIVWNRTCANGSIGGTVSGQGVLRVDSIDAVDTTGTADNNYADGWRYIFHVTLPTNEPNVAMKFSDWISGSTTMPVANNMRISSAQANNGGATVTVTAANTYTTPDLHIITDLDPSRPGIQTDIVVEVKIPTGTQNASYTTTYGVRSQ